MNLEDRSSRPWSCPHQMDPVVESRVLALRDAHPVWGPDRIRYELEHEGVDPVPCRSGIYRALVRGGRVDPPSGDGAGADYRRWERGRPMELWQMDVVGGIHLADGTEVKCVTGIDDNSRFVVSAKLVARATARPVCEALLEALRRHGVPEQILTDNGKVFTGRFGPGGTASEVLFDRICAENGIRHLLTAPRSPTTTGKVERLHKTMRAEFFTAADRRHATIEALQAGVGRLGGRVQHRASAPVAGDAATGRAVRAGHRAGAGQPVVPAPRSTRGRLAPAVEPCRDRRPTVAAGVRRWVELAGQVRLAGFIYRVPVVLAGEPVQCVVGRQPGADLPPRRAGRLPRPTPQTRSPPIAKAPVQGSAGPEAPPRVRR